MNPQQKISFCRQWLAAWTGNNPQHLLSFYGPHAFYRDPARPDGVKGQEALKVYFEKLLAKNPDWVWEMEEVFSTEKGFTLKWKATVPFGGKNVVFFGLDIVEMEGEKITRNEVYFDPSPLKREVS
ncbi:MAG: nuclear transport factor 2 family protein [bacterium]